MAGQNAVVSLSLTNADINLGGLLGEKTRMGGQTTYVNCRAHVGLWIPRTEMCGVHCHKIQLRESEYERGGNNF